MFITFEGIEGAGKGTLIQRLGQWLEKQGIVCHYTREPGGSDLGKHLRAILLDTRTRVIPQAELLLYLADRAQHVAEVIRPALAEKKWVLCDRYADSTIVYQGFGRGLDIAELVSLNQLAVEGLWPTLTFLLDVPPEIGLPRARSRNAAQGIATTEGRFEAEHMAFHHRTRNGYLQWAQQNSSRFRVLDATLTPELLAKTAQSFINKEILERSTAPANLLPREVTLATHKGKSS